MTKPQKLCLLLPIMGAVLYALFAFVSWEINPAEWGNFWRGMFVWLWLAATVPAAGLILEIP